MAANTLSGSELHVHVRPLIELQRRSLKINCDRGPREELSPYQSRLHHLEIFILDIFQETSRQCIIFELNCIEGRIINIPPIELKHQIPT